MKVAITGGTGFLGRKLTARLLARGDSVLVFSRSANRRGLPEPVELVRWNPLAEPCPAATLDGLDAVVNLMGETVAGLWTPAKKQRIFGSRVLGTRNLAEGFRQASRPPGLLLSSSAVGIYGNRGDEELTEASPPGEGFLADVGRGWESAATPVQELGTRLVWLRTSLPLDPGGGLLRALLPSFRFGLGAFLGNGQQWFPWIHLEDWLDLALFALDQETITGPLNASAPHPVRNEEFTRTLARVLGRPAFLRAPAFALRMLPGGMAEETVLVSERVIPQAAVAAGFAFRFPELEPALRDLV